METRHLDTPSVDRRLESMAESMVNDWTAGATSIISDWTKEIVSVIDEHLIESYDDWT